MKYQYPFKGRNRMTCPFGKIGSWKAGWHIGVDLVGDDDKIIYPIAQGVVESINAHGKAYGNHVCIRHPDGMVSLYAHLEYIKVKRYDTVYCDTPLGKMGATGNVSGAHLHLELHRGKYRYPNKPQAECDWLFDAVKWIERFKKEESEHMEIRDLEIIKDGKKIIVDAVNIEGSNYIKLRDIEKLCNIQVDFERGTPILTTSNDFMRYNYKYHQTRNGQTIATHTIRVWEVNPKLLKAKIVKGNLNDVAEPFMINAGYGWWTDKARKEPYGLSVLVSEGKVLCNCVPHNKPCGTLIVYTNGSVQIKQIDDITKEENVSFAIGGMTIAPRVSNTDEGFTGIYSDVIRECPRVVMGYNERTCKVIVAGYKKMSAVRGRDLLHELGCGKGITLDAGGSALMKEEDNYFLKTDGRTQFGCIYIAK